VDAAVGIVVPGGREEMQTAAIKPKFAHVIDRFIAGPRLIRIRL
jgi:hypothetical protein